MFDFKDLAGFLPVIGTLLQGGAKRNQRDYAATLYDANAGVARLQAEDAITRGKADENLSRIATKGLIGRQRAAMGAQGVDINRDSALDVVEDAAAMGELEAMTIRNNAAMEAWGYKVQAAGFGGQAGLQRAAGRTEFSGSVLTAGLRAYDLFRESGKPTFDSPSRRLKNSGGYEDLEY